MEKFVLSLLLTALLIADGLHLFHGNTTMINDEIVQAGLIPLIYNGKKHYNEQGEFDGCLVGGDECIIITTAFRDINISDEGIHLQN